jgi:NADH-ubiquinone oxidoreductase chain 4
LHIRFFSIDFGFYGNIFIFIIIFVFLVKFPIYFVHLWLPRAHVEAPVAGSMVLAGVLLKLGGYGLIRVIMIIKYGCSLAFMLILVIGLIGGLYRGVICLGQVDIKRLIAYSSVVHIGIVIRGLFTINNCGVVGRFLIMVGHAFCSSALFMLSGFFYKIVGRRSMILLKGLRRDYSLLKYFWFFLILGNISSPPTFRIVAEIWLFISLMSYYAYLFLVLVFFSFIGSCYNLYLYGVLHANFGYFNFTWEGVDVSKILNYGVHGGVMILIFLKLIIFVSLISLLYKNMKLWVSRNIVKELFYTQFEEFCW